MDALADILESVHLSGSVYCRSELNAPWGMELPDSDTTQFHVVRRGRCWMMRDGASPLRLETGDMVMLPKGTAHALADDPATPPRPLSELIACNLSEPMPTGVKPPLVIDGGGDPTTLICGYVRFDEGAAHPLLSVLPEVVHVRGEGGRALNWLETILDLIAQESTAGRPGGEILINRLTEAFFIQVIRTHLETQTDPEPSWLAGLRDPRIASALGLIHREPGEAWTVDTLAARVGLSRSGFSARFRGLVGEPPLQYLTRWRMQVAANHLQDGRLSLAEVADAVGYRAEASFAKVFKRMVGVAPGAFRRRAQGPAVAVR